jgi:hypothetical protein
MKQVIFFSIVISFLGLYTIVPARAQWVQASTGLPTNIVPSTFVTMGTSIFAGGGGVFVSSDSGTNWTGVNSGLTSLVEVLAVSGTDLFAGTFDGGVFLSTNSGINWTAVNSGLTGFSNAKVMALFALGTNLFVGIKYSGVFLSTNNGASWKAVNKGLLDSVHIVSLTISGTNLLAGTDSGVYLSSDTGSNWSAVRTGMPAGHVYVGALAVSGTNIFAGCDNEGVFLSTDQGLNWTLASNGLPDAYVMAFAVSGKYLFAGMYGYGIFLTTNNGQNWTNVSTGLTLNPFYIFSLGVSGDNLFAGMDSGVWRRSLSDFNSSGVAQLTSPEQQPISAYPNPFSQSSTITFSCAESGVGEVTIVNLLGSVVARIFSGELTAGEHSFEWDASGAAAGMYECIVRVGGSVQRIALVCGPK